MTSREFTRDDWMGLCGAERWADGSLPLIRELNQECDATADKNGIQIFFNSESDEALDGISFGMICEWPSQAAARLFLDALPESLTADDCRRMGFEQVS